MIHIQVPVLVKIRDGITVNLTNSFSQAVERQQPQFRLKKDFKGDKPTADDYEEYAKVDTVSFWFTDGRSLCYRVGQEITQEDFDRIDSQMTSLQFRSHDRKPSDNKANK